MCSFYLPAAPAAAAPAAAPATAPAAATPAKVIEDCNTQ